MELSPDRIAQLNGTWPRHLLSVQLHGVGHRKSLSPAVTFDVIADARLVRIGRNTSFGRVMLLGAADKRPVGMVASAYSML